MKRTTTSARRLHSLLFSPCTCCLTPGRQCLACCRWRKHYRVVTERRAAVRAAGEPAPDRTAAPAGSSRDNDDGADPWLSGGER